MAKRKKMVRLVANCCFGTKENYNFEMKEFPISMPNPFISLKNFSTTNHEWQLLLDYIVFLNEKEQFPLFETADFNDMAVFDGYMLSSAKVKKLHDMIDSSFDDGTLQEYNRTYLSNEEYSHLFIKNVSLFLDFTKTCKGFQIFN